MANIHKFSFLLYGIPARTSEQEVQNLFRNYSPSVHCELLTAKGTSSGTSALIIPNTCEQQIKILSKKFRLHGRQLFCVEYDRQLIKEQPKEHEDEPGKIFLKKVPPRTQDHELADFLRQYGPLVYCYLIKSGNRRSRKFGFARFQDPQHALNLTATGTVEFKGQPIMVNIFQDRVKANYPNPNQPTAHGLRGQGGSGSSLPKQEPKQDPRKFKKESDRDHHVFKVAGVKYDHRTDNLRTNPVRLSTRMAY